ncbi:MAG: Oxidoreductase, short-chain dehydrogenase/reductase family, partial [uncultured Acidimicrobiales bacterium]
DRLARPTPAGAAARRHLRARAGRRPPPRGSPRARGAGRPRRRSPGRGRGHAARQPHRGGRAVRRRRRARRSAMDRRRLRAPRGVRPGGHGPRRARRPGAGRAQPHRGGRRDAGEPGDPCRDLDGPRHPHGPGRPGRAGRAFVGGRHSYPPGQLRLRRIQGRLRRVRPGSRAHGGGLGRPRADRPPRLRGRPHDGGHEDGSDVHHPRSGGRSRGQGDRRRGRERLCAPGAAGGLRRAAPGAPTDLPAPASV